jgi:hypothetical protein
LRYPPRGGEHESDDKKGEHVNILKSLAVLALALPVSSLAQPLETPERAPKGDSKIERAAEKAGAAIDKTARKVERGVKKAATKTGEALETAGKKTEKWVKEKTK